MMTDELQAARARKQGHDGLAEYLETRARLLPPPVERAKEATAERVECGPNCIRSADHTGPHLPPLPPAAEQPTQPSIESAAGESVAEEEMA